MSYFHLTTLSKSIIKNEFEQRFDTPIWFTQLFEGEKMLEYTREQCIRNSNIESGIKFRMDVIKKATRELKAIGGFEKFSIAWDYLRSQYSKLFVEKEE